MAKVLMHVSACYDGETTPAGEVLVCDPEFAKRAVLFGHGDLLDAGAPLSFEAACERLRATADEVVAAAAIRAQALAERAQG
jgi:hypothetical protein